MKGTKIVTEEDNSPVPVIDQETLQSEQATLLLQRQHALESDVPVVMKELDLTWLHTVGTVRQVGSSNLGLMTWRDIDLAVSSPGLSIERAFEVMHAAYTHSMVKRVHYANESGKFNPTGLPHDERFYFGVYYDTHTHGDWKIDISFWLAEGIHPEPVHDAVKRSEERR